MRIAAILEEIEHTRRKIFKPFARHLPSHMGRRRLRDHWQVPKVMKNNTNAALTRSQPQGTIFDRISANFQRSNQSLSVGKDASYGTSIANRSARSCHRRSLLLFGA
jgi:hypothetical protein